MLTGVSHGPKPPRIVRSQAPIVGALVTRYHRLDIDRHPAGRERGEELVPGAPGEDPVPHGKDQPVERGEMFEGDKLDTAFALRLRLVGERIGNQSGAAELAQFGDDFRDAALSRTFSGDAVSRPYSSSDSQGRVPGAASAARQKGTFNRRHSYDPCAGTADRVGFLYRRKLTVCQLTDP
jgi:hypothetical protein